MKIKIGRNALCPCGSGKKYKNCCLGKIVSANKDLSYRKLRDVHDQLVDKLFKYAAKSLGPDVLIFAWGNFIFYTDEIYDENSLHKQVFFPWMLYHWFPDADCFETEDDFKEWDDYTIAESFAEDYSNQLSAIEKQFIDIVISTPYSFYEIIECQPGIGFTLKNILTDQEIDVQEQMGSKNAQKNQIIFAQVIQIDSIGMMMGTSSYYFSPAYKIDVLELKADIEEEGSIGELELFEWEDEIRMLYFDLFDRISTPPQLTNTDGDPLILHELFYDIKSLDLVFEKLSVLAIGTKRKELLEHAEIDEKGNLLSVEFPWLKKGNPKHKSWENTVLGHIVIEKNRLKVNVNSEKRAERIKEKIQALLGNKAKYKTTKIQSLESLQEKKEDFSQHAQTQETEELMKNPEMQILIEQQMEQHWQNWIYDKLPALNNKTPAEMVKDKIGREKVKALLEDFELREKNAPPHLKQMKYIKQVKKRLGLSD